jgi:hypothetical protein
LGTAQLFSQTGPGTGEEPSGEGGVAPPRLERVRGPRIGFDLAGLPLLYFEPERMIYTGFVDFEAMQDIYPVIEGGYQHVRIVKDIYRYSSSGWFTRAGVDVNLMNYHRNDVYEMIYAGIRYGFSNFSQQADGILIREDYFGDLEGGSIPENRMHAHWVSLAGGVRVELFKDFFLGWSVLGNIKLARSDDHGTAPYNIPGFGSGGKRASLAMTYTLSYRIPVQTYIPKKIIKRKKQP